MPYDALRSVNQESAKQEALQSLDSQSVLVVIDWAMKFLQMKYREKQSEWFAKRGLSWHTKNECDLKRPRNAES